MINNEPMTSEEIKTQTIAPKYAVDEFIRQIQRHPSRNELNYIGRWNPQQAVRQAELNPDGEPDRLIAVKVPNVWNDVSIYAELTVTTLHGPNYGLVNGFKSLRYHDGDDAAWPLRTQTGELMRSDGGHLIRSPAFRAKFMSEDNAAECRWPTDVQNRPMWHLETFIRPMWDFQKKKPPHHLMVEGPAQILKPAPTREQELERRIAELENARKK